MLIMNSSYFTGNKISDDYIRGAIFTLIVISTLAMITNIYQKLNRSSSENEKPSRGSSAIQVNMASLQDKKQSPTQNKSFLTEQDFQRQYFRPSEKQFQPDQNLNLINQSNPPTQYLSYFKDYPPIQQSANNSKQFQFDVKQEVVQLNPRSSSQDEGRRGRVNAFQALTNTNVKKSFSIEKKNQCEEQQYEEEKKITNLFEKSEAAVKSKFKISMHDLSSRSKTWFMVQFLALVLNNMENLLVQLNNILEKNFDRRVRELQYFSEGGKYRSTMATSLEDILAFNNEVRQLLFRIKLLLNKQNKWKFNDPNRFQREDRAHFHDFCQKLQFYYDLTKIGDYQNKQIVVSYFEVTTYQNDLFLSKMNRFLHNLDKSQAMWKYFQSLLYLKIVSKFFINCVNNSANQEIVMAVQVSNHFCDFIQQGRDTMFLQQQLEQVQLSEVEDLVGKKQIQKAMLVQQRFTYQREPHYHFYSLLLSKELNQNLCFTPVDQNNWFYWLGYYILHMTLLEKVKFGEPMLKSIVEFSNEIQKINP